MTRGITLLGLGPGDPALLTGKARETIDGLGEIYLRTKQHPLAASLPEKTRVFDFDRMMGDGDLPEESIEKIVQTVLELGERPQGVTYAVPGSPFVGESTCPEIFRRAKEKGIPVRVVEGLSFLEPVCTTLEIDLLPRMVMVDALELAALHHVNFPPAFPALVSQVHSREIAAEMKMTLLTVYPDQHPVKLVHSAGNPDQVVESIALSEIDRSSLVGPLTVLFVPPLEPDTSFEAFQEVVAHLRAPEGCPWDREQTHISLRKALLEETYEALHAIDIKDPRKLAEELGDILLQIVLHSQIASEEGDFSMVDVLQGINQKIVRRHPHVFGDLKLRGMDHLLTNWEKLKAAERKENGEVEKSLLDGVPDILPALTQAQEVQDRAARVGFDWKDIRGVMDKIIEEIREIDEARDPAELTDEMGDLLFAVVNYARWRKVDPEFALRDTTMKFRKRFGFIEKKARLEGREVSQLTFDELNDAWDEAKNQDH